MIERLGTPPDLEELASREAIREILHLHSRALDRCEAEWLKSAYWPDAVVDYGGFKGRAHVFADVVAGALAEAYELTQHFIGNTLFEIRGSKAKTESYVTAHHLVVGGKEDLHYSGRYLDELERRDGCWKLCSRVVVMDWSRRLVVKDERSEPAFADLAKGTHSGRDPLHAFWSRSN